MNTALASLRSARERVLQTLWFEGLGLVIVAPLYGWVAGAGMAESFALIAAVSLAVMVWAALFNTVFDAIEWRLAGRVASEQHGAHRATAEFSLDAVPAECRGPGFRRGRGASGRRRSGVSPARAPGKASGNHQKARQGDRPLQSDGAAQAAPALLCPCPIMSQGTLAQSRAVSRPGRAAR